MSRGMYLQSTALFAYPFRIRLRTRREANLVLFNRVYYTQDRRLVLQCRFEIGHEFHRWQYFVTLQKYTLPLLHWLGWFQCS